MMIPVDDARSALLQHPSILAAKPVPLAAACGRVLREAVAAPHDLPAFDRSAFDGYAINVGDASPDFEIIAELRAGDADQLTVGIGQAVRIFTGARLPAPGLRVVMQEEAGFQGERVILPPGGGAANIRRQGEDARAGEVLLQPGTVLNAAAVALLATLGKTTPLVSRLPRILHVTTGDEIVPAGQTPASGQIRDSNGPLIAALLAEQGIPAPHHLHLPDDPAAVRQAALEAKKGEADLVLVSGGSGPGSHDLSPLFFEHLGCPVRFRNVNVRPGKPILFGADGVRSAFGLPGNPLSHFVCFHLFVRPLLRHLQGLAPESFLTGVTAREMPSLANARETWVPSTSTWEEGRVKLTPLRWQSSGDITRLPAANALMRIPAETPSLASGALVEFLFTRPLS